MFNEEIFVIRTIFGEYNCFSYEVTKCIYNKFNDLFNLHFELLDVPESIKNKCILLRDKNNNVCGKLDRIDKKIVEYSYNDKDYSLKFTYNDSTYDIDFKMIKCCDNEPEICFWNDNFHKTKDNTFIYYNSDSIKQACKLAERIGVNYKKVLFDKAYAIIPDIQDHSCSISSLCSMVDNCFKISNREKNIKLR